MQETGGGFGMILKSMLIKALFISSVIFGFKNE